MTGYTHDAPQVLDADACWDLVEGTHVARLAVSVRGEPDIFPVTVRAHERTIAFRTVPGTKLATLVTNERVALEWDHVDGDGAWSVVARGTAHRIRSEHEVDAVQEDAPPLVPTVDVPTEEWVVVEARDVTGRRFARSGG
ncbi:pyridoxamine 5'-phosphate oxidase family protein [Cellulosimicrobium protaetiae]|uniref:Pyridoxamine 5'-phosphate oxidase family protein n=1 Tax=Cellulosimicrobium protaetiae TaxID=2587808 RepID=A0A6M5UHK6_9MICO|nr:pyridoxamine 5'-phosphate oxidase family protein [Cellulosimicrobium protaetiae]QJW37042.1 pyridoxamine 5'-phosphate oxidase family protein [Cellulosimicrobium protaetiae]